MADRIKIAELDFDTIKNNLKSFLQQQSEFVDYDFDGSGLSVLLDLLAYNTHYQAYYLNMVSNEAFLDTAVLRESVVSHAKTLGYRPHSKTAAVATINVVVPTTDSLSGVLTIPRGYGFLSDQIDGNSYRFIVLNDTISTKSGNNYYFDNLAIHEGQMNNYMFVHNRQQNPKQIYTIPDLNIDMSTLMVSVSPSIANTNITVYSLINDELDVESNGNVYFIQEGLKGNYEIYFGDDVLGNRLGDGNVIYLSYVVTNSTAANKANNFIATATLTAVEKLSESSSETYNKNYTNILVTPVTAAEGGGINETVDEIKYNAPLQYLSQNRIVTAKDYELYIRKSYPDIDSISVWGGDEEYPPIYGKVFISLKPKDGYYISEIEKTRIIDEIINPKVMMTVKTEIRNPEFLYILTSSYVEYNKDKTSLSNDALKNKIKEAILLYKQTYLNKFGSRFVISKLQEYITNVDLNSIVGCDTFVYAQKRFDPTLESNNNYTIDFGIPLIQSQKNKLTTTEFSVYDNNGILRNVIIEEIPKSTTGVNSIEIVDAGANYTTAPIVTITGDGIGASAVATIYRGKLTGVTVTNPGMDYNKAIVTFSGGGGNSATALAKIDASFGQLRLVYYDVNSVRQVVDNLVGTIDYTNGIVQLNDINILQVSSTDGYVRINCAVKSGIIQTTKNNIISIDSGDSSSITIDLQAVK
jgi:hypothetical protein